MITIFLALSVNSPDTSTLNFFTLLSLFNEHALLSPSFIKITLGKHEQFYGIIICTRNFLQVISEFLIYRHHYRFMLLVRPHYSTLVLTKVPHKATCLSHQMPPHLPLIIPSHSYLNTIKTSLTHSHKLHTQTQVVVKHQSYSLGEAMKSSSVAPSLKQEQGDASKLQEGVLNNLELRLGISSDNGLSGGGGGGGTTPWLGVGVHPWSLSARQDKAALEQPQQRSNECPAHRFGYQLPQTNCCFFTIMS